METNSLDKEKIRAAVKSQMEAMIAEGATQADLDTFMEAVKEKYGLNDDKQEEPVTEKKESAQAKSPSLSDSSSGSLQSESDGQMPEVDYSSSYVTSVEDMIKNASQERLQNKKPLVPEEEQEIEDSAWGPEKFEQGQKTVNQEKPDEKLTQIDSKKDLSTEDLEFLQEKIKKPGYFQDGLFNQQGSADEAAARVIVGKQAQRKLVVMEDLNRVTVKGFEEYETNIQNYQAEKEKAISLGDNETAAMIDQSLIKEAKYAKQLQEDYDNAYAGMLKQYQSLDKMANEKHSSTMEAFAGEAITNLILKTPEYVAQTAATLTHLGTRTTPGGAGMGTHEAMTALNYLSEKTFELFETAPN